MTDDTPRARLGYHLTRSRTAAVLGGLALLGGGVAAGAAAVQATGPSVMVAPATPTAIRSLAGGIVTVRGRAVEVFGNKVVIEDATGRALADLGREGEDGSLVRSGEAVTVQGRFEHGFVHAAFLVGADGKVRALGPLAAAPPPRGACAPIPPMKGGATPR